MNAKPLQFILLCLLASNAWAEPRENLTLPQALARTLQRSPELAAYSWDLRAAEARKLQAGLWPNPEVGVEVKDVTGSGDFRSGDRVERMLQLSQLIELGGKRAARVEQADYERAMTAWAYQVRRIEVLKETAQAFFDVLAAQRQIALEEENVSLAQRAVPLAEQLLETGRGSAAEATQTSVAWSLARIGLVTAQRQLAAARAVLASKWGAQTADFNQAVGDLARIPPVPKLSALSARVAANPQLARWATERERRRASLRLAEARSAPDLTVRAGPALMGKGEDVTLGVIGFSIPLPIFDRNQGNIAAARAELAKVEDERHAAEARAHSALAVAYQALVRASEEVGLLQKDVLPAADQTVTLMTEGFSAGSFTTLQILDARRTLTAARTQHLRALTEYHKALAEVEALTAGPVDLHASPAAPRRKKK